MSLAEIFQALTQGEHTDEKPFEKPFFMAFFIKSGYLIFLLIWFVWFTIRRYRAGYFVRFLCPLPTHFHEEQEPQLPSTCRAL